MNIQTVESRVKERTVGLEMALRQMAEREREEDHARFREQYKRELRSEFDEKLAKQVDLWDKGVASQERKAAEEAIARQRPNRPIASNTAKHGVAAPTAEEFKEFRLPRSFKSVSVLCSMSPHAVGIASYAEATLQGKRRNERSTAPSDTGEEDESRPIEARKSATTSKQSRASQRRGEGSIQSSRSSRRSGAPSHQSSASQRIGPLITAAPRRLGVGAQERRISRRNRTRAGAIGGSPSPSIVIAAEWAGIYSLIPVAPRHFTWGAREQGADSRRPADACAVGGTTQAACQGTRGALRTPHAVVGEGIAPGGQARGGQKRGPECGVQ